MTPDPLIPFDARRHLDAADVSLVLNRQARCPVLLLLDTSASMRGAPASELGAALPTLAAHLREDPLARKRVEIATVTFGGEVALEDFVSAEAWLPSALTDRIGGSTPMAQALIAGLEALDRRLTAYDTAQVKRYTPLAFLLTDGHPDPGPAIADAVARVRAAQAAGRLALFPVAIGAAADEAFLACLGPRAPKRLAAGGIPALFEWVSLVGSSVAASVPGTQIPVPPVDTWAAI